MSVPSVAVIDIGSNSIKLLVARRSPDGQLEAVATNTVDARIGTGISGNLPRLMATAMDGAIRAIADLLEKAAPHQPASRVLVATSAVRDAANGDDFAKRVESDFGLALRVLSGAEEAAYIGQGIGTDPALARFADFDLYDLGGGSLECLRFRNRQPVRFCSLPLGCVRLTELFIREPGLPMNHDDDRAILVREGWPQLESHTATVVGTGGSLTTVRAIAAAAGSHSFSETDPVITVKHLEEALAKIGSLPIEERRRLPGLPPRRADVMPAALATLVALAKEVGFDAYRHSLHNLRWGIAAELLTQ
jgi:exopolyphosphatase/guanosine-5'-triphosphate,3'-diphosphate pyrophosphatase